jgi:ribosomal protein L33
MAKGKYVVVLLESLAGTLHRHIVKRPRLGEKVEMIKFDPWVQQYVLYREVAKIKTLKDK